PRVDYLLIAAPATKDTEGMVGRRQFERMKRSAFLINVSRGEIVDQEALVETLNNDGIAGEAIAVFVPDPLPAGHPLSPNKRVEITPHISAISPMLWHRIMEIFVENIRRFVAKQPLINQIDKSRGY